MIFTISMPALAIEPEYSEPEYSDTALVDLSNEISLEVSLIKENQKSSEVTNFEIKQFNNGQLVRKVTQSEDGRFLVEAEYENDVIVGERIIEIADRVEVLPSQSSSEIYSENKSSEYLIGYIFFNPLIGETKGECLRAYCDPYLVDDESYKINGKASDTLATIAGIIAGCIIGYQFPAKDLCEYIAAAIIGWFGGSLAADTIGVFFSETVSVESHYYDMRCYKLSAGTYSNTYGGISRQVQTKQSQYYSQWFHEGATPSTWKNGDMLAIWCWYDMYAEYCPGVDYYA